MLFLGIDALTMIMLPILYVSLFVCISLRWSDGPHRLLVKFRTWLDGARLLFLLVCHIGTALSFAVWYPTISCPDDSESSRYENNVV